MSGHSSGKDLLRNRHDDDFNQIIPREVGADAGPLRALSE